MQFETRKLADLHPAEYNPRKKLTPSDPEYVHIKNSINEFGYADPIVINADGTIIKGHQQCNVMIDLGYTEAEVIVLDIPDKAKEKALKGIILLQILFVHIQNLNGKVNKNQQTAMH